MQCTIYTLEEKKRLTGKGGLLVLARWKGGLILERDEINALWRLPQGGLQRGEDPLEAARRALGKAIGEAVFDVTPLCGYSLIDEAGKEQGGTAYLADVSQWTPEEGCGAQSFDRMPLSSQVYRPVLVFGLHKWAGVFFDERLDLEKLGEPGIGA